MSVPGVERAGGLRLIRIVLVCLALGVALNTAGIVTTLFLNGDRVDQINAERVRNIVRSCEETNARNAAGIRELDVLLAGRSDGASPAQVEHSRRNTRRLIDAIVPVRDCAALARSQVANP